MSLINTSYKKLLGDEIEKIDKIKYEFNNDFVELNLLKSTNQ